MKSRAARVGLILPLLCVLIGQARQGDFPVLRGPYLGQIPPGKEPRVFAPGIVSTDKTEHGTVTFSREGNEVFWAVIFAEPFRKKIMFSKVLHGQWTPPQIAAFSTGVNEGNPMFSPDGTKLIFTSWKSLAGNAKRKHYIMFSQRTEDGWGEAVLFDDVVNSISIYWHHSLAANGNLDFMSEAEGAGIYVSEFKDGRYQKPYKIDLGFPASTPFVAEDESYVIFSAADRPDGRGEIDLYVSYRKADGSWTTGRNLGEGINSAAIDIWPVVSPDGKYLFFTSSRNGNMDIYWVDAGMIGLDGGVVRNARSGEAKRPEPCFSGAVDRADTD